MPTLRKFKKKSAGTRRSVNITSNDQKRADKIRGSRQWKKVREYMLDLYPMCIHSSCDETIAQEVHHILPVVTHPEMAFTPWNLAPLCVKCHHELEAKERQGIRTDNLFRKYQKQVKEKVNEF